MLKLRKIQFVIFPKAVVSADFINNYSEKIKSLIGGHETIFGLPQEAPPDIPRLIVSDEKTNFIFTYNRIDLIFTNISEEITSLENPYLEKIKAVFKETRENRDILLDKVGIVFDFILTGEDSSILWQDLINDDANRFAQIQEEKSLRIVTEKNDPNHLEKTQHLLFSQYKTESDELETLISIDLNNIHKDYPINSAEKLNTFLNETNDDIFNIIDKIEAIYTQVS
jgi:hypothetical protein